MLLLFLLLLSAMSSYLFIIKSELPLVIQSFLKNEASNEWETAVKVITALMDPLCRGVDFMFLEYWLLSSVCLTVFFCREWFLNGNILIIIVSIFIILPLAIMKQLGMFSILSSHFFFLHTVCFVAFCQVHFHVLFFFLFLFFIIHCHWFYCWFRHLFFHCPPGYLGYTSGFSLSCMVFFLISVSQTEHTNKQIIVNCNQPYP